MDLRNIITQWMAEKHPELKIDNGSVWLTIRSEYITQPQVGDVWYVCRIDEDRVHLFNPAKKKFGDVLMAGLPTFLEQLDAVIEFYKAYIP